jgi:hypothetical protein
MPAMQGHSLPCGSKGTPMVDEHRFIVTGLDADGDRYTFETDDPSRAEATLNQFSEDLEVVRLSDRQGEDRGPSS